MIAQSRTPGKQHEVQNDSDLSRIFVVVPKTFTEDELRAKFADYNDNIEYCQILKDRDTREPKGVAYVKFKKPSTAALAIETCDRSLKAVIAEPKSSKLKQQKMEKEKNVMSAFAAAMQGIPVNPFMEQQALNFHDAKNTSSNTSLVAAQATVSEGIASTLTNKRLFVVVSPSVTHDQVSSLFDLVPGMEYCDLKRDHNTHESRGIAYVMYTSVGSAIYAKEKLNGFEYPPGSRLVIKFAEENTSHQNGNKSNTNPGNELSFLGVNPASQSFVNPMANMMSVPFNAGQSQMHQPLAATASSTNPSYSTAALPDRQSLAEPNSQVAARLFIVCQPVAPPEHILKDVFCRYGNLIDIWMVSNRNFGYAKFANKDSANAAIAGLNGQEVLGMKMKVLHADPPKNESSRKRPRV